MAVKSTYEEVESIISLMGYEVDSSVVYDLAIRLSDIRGGNNCTVVGPVGFSCLQRGGSGVWTWIKSRLKELNLLPPAKGEMTPEIVSGVFHFYAWDEEKYGKYEDNSCCATLFQRLQSGTQRSPISRLSNAKPVNLVTCQLVQQFDTSCPYCNRYFRNPAAMRMHLMDFHSVEINEYISLAEIRKAKQEAKSAVLNEAFDEGFE